MPELPDVEVFVRNIDKLFAHKKVSKIKVINGKKLKDSAAALSRALTGRKLERVYRSGKEMRFQFDNGTLLGLHLMLTGDLFLMQKKKVFKFAIIEIYFKDGTGLVLTDRMRNANVKLDPVDKAGVDAISKEMNFKYLKLALNRKTNIKNVLTDQDSIRGIGNSYSDEILWAARISPFSIAAAIPDDKIKDLLKHLKHILKKEIRNLYKVQAGKINGEVKDFLLIHTKSKDKSPTGARIIIKQKGMMKTYYTKEQQLYK